MVVVVVVKTLHMKTKDVGVASKGSLLKKAGREVQAPPAMRAKKEAHRNPNH